MDFKDGFRKAEDAVGGFAKKAGEEGKDLLNKAGEEGKKIAGEAEEEGKKLKDKFGKKNG